MNPNDNPKKFVLVQECSDGNDSVGSEWLETKIFSGNVSLEEVHNWAKSLHGCGGKLILTLSK